MNHLTSILLLYANGLDVMDAPEAMMFEDLYQSAKNGKCEDLVIGLQIAFDRLMLYNADVVREIIRAMLDDIYKVDGDAA
jgi:hypothetical protein